MRRSKLTLLSCLIISTLAASSARAGEIGRAPLPPPWQGDLSGAKEQDGGTWLPQNVADEVLFRLTYLDQGYPFACQATLDAQKAVLEARIDTALSMERARARAALLEQAAQSEAKGWHWYEVALAVVGGAAAGLAVGYSAGALR